AGPRRGAAAAWPFPRAWAVRLLRPRAVRSWAETTTARPTSKGRDTARSGVLARAAPLWQGSPRFSADTVLRFSPPARRCRSSVVEPPLGKGEVVSSILTGSTTINLGVIGEWNVP